MRLVLAFCMILLGSVASEALEPPRLQVAEQDNQGILWAFTREDKGTAFTFDGSKWNAVNVPFASRERAIAQSAIPMPDGAVCCLWSVNNERVAATWHRGDTSRILAQYSGNPPDKTRLFADSQNRLWITGKTPDIRRIDSKTGSVFAYRLKPDEILNTYEGWNTVETAEDGHGRIWIWSNIIHGGNRLSSIRGVLVFDGDKAERKEITGFQGTFFTFLGRKDKNHMWLGVIDDGLYEVDIDTMQATLVAPPTDGAFRHIDKIFNIGTDVFAIAFSRPSNTSLWRFRNGQWERLIDRLDNLSTTRRSWAVTKEGLLISGNPSAWFVSEKQPPARLEWRNGFPIEDGYNFLICKEETLFAINGFDGSLFLRKVHLPPPSPGFSRITPLDIREGWTMDTKEHIWAFSKIDYAKALKEWDGNTWQRYNLPPGIEIPSIAGVEADREGRIWIIPSLNDRIGAFFDSKEKKWNTFPKIEAAFESVKNNPPHFINPHRWNYIPIYSASGDRIAFRSGKWEIAYFDGSQWQYWKRTSIAPGGNTSLGVPFFDASDKLCVNYKKITRCLDGYEWKPVDFEDRYPTDEFSETYQRGDIPKPPPGCVTSEPDSIVYDNQGTAWLTWNGDLYKCRDGVSAKVFSPDEPTPPTLRRNLRAVTISHDGSALVETFPGNPAWFLIASKTTPPQITLKTKFISADSVQIEFKANPSEKVFFRWRLDDEPWQTAYTKTIRLDAQSNGEHRFQAQAVNEELQITPIPAETRYTVKIDPSRQMNAFIARLSDPDFAVRKTAIEALSRQPDAALPALKAARPTASDDQRWWIDAAIQQIERDQRSRTKNP